MKKFITIFILFCFAFDLNSYSNTTKRVNSANKLYRKQKFKEALEEYNKIYQNMQDSDLINFNMGAVLYKNGDYKTAIQHFQKALEKTTNKNFEEKILYNLGNSHYMLGKLTENIDPKEAEKNFNEALYYYKRAILLNNNNIDAKFNYELTLAELKALQMRQLQRSPQTKEGKEGKKDDKSDLDKTQSDKKDQQDKSTSKQSTEQKESTKDTSGKSDTKENQESSTDKQKEKDTHYSQFQYQPFQAQSQSYSSQQYYSQNLTEEEAKSILDRYIDSYLLPDYFNTTQRVKKKEVLKDW